MIRTFMVVSAAIAGICQGLVAQDALVPAVAPTLRLTNSAAQDQDDMCVWIDHAHPERSLIICSDKTASHLFVYELTGKLKQTVDLPKPGNIDLRQGVVIGQMTLDLIVVNQRSEGFRLVPFRMNHDTRQLERIDAQPMLTGPNYGGCLAYDASAERTYFFSTTEEKIVEQHEFLPAEGGKIVGRKVREIPIGKCEGAVADDRTQTVFIAEEEVGIWKFPVAPEKVARPELVAGVGEHGLLGDLEGITIVRRNGFSDLLVVSDQGRSRYVAFELESPHQFVGEFSIQGASETDGIEVVMQPLGEGFPAGAFFCHTDLTPHTVLVTPIQLINTLKVPRQ